jgi:hypothetical protein
MPYAQPADPGWYRNFEYGGVDSDRGRRRLGVWVEACSPGPRRPRVPHEAWRGPFCNRWAIGDVFSNPTGALYLGIGTRSRPGHAHGRPGGGQIRAYDRGSSGGSSHPPAYTRHGAGRAGGGCDSAADSSQHRRIGPGGRGNGDGAAESHRQPIAATSPGRGRCDSDGAAESHRQPIAAASSGRRRPGSAGVRVVQPRVARTRTTGKSSTVRRVFPNRSSGDHFPFSVWKRTLTATSARNRS